MAQANDLLRPNKKILIMVPMSPERITGRRPIRSDNMPHCIPVYEKCPKWSVT